MSSASGESSEVVFFLDIKGFTLFKRRNLFYPWKSQNKPIRLLKIRGIVRSYARHRMNENNDVLVNSKEVLQKGVGSFIKVQTSELSIVEKQVRLLHPENVLKRGYSITRLNGKAITGISEIAENDIVETTLFAGKIISTVNSIEKKGKHK